MGGAPEHQGVQGGGGVHVGDPGRDGDRVHEGRISRRDTASRPLESRERGRGFADAKQMLERDNVAVATVELARKGATCRPTRAWSSSPGPGPALLEPETGAWRSISPAGAECCSWSIPSCRGPARRRPDLGLARCSPAGASKLGDDIVIDPANAAPMVGPETVIANHYGNHPIVRSLAGEGLPVMFRSPDPSRRPTRPRPVSGTMLVETTPEGWGETGLGSSRRGRQEGRLRHAGPVTLAWAIGPADEKKAGAKPARAVVIGQLAFIDERGSRQRGKHEPVLERGPLADRRGEARRDRSEDARPGLALADAVTGSPDRLCGMLGMPAFAIALGIWVWYRRRD